MNKSNWSGRTARTVEECFGPYSRLDVKQDTPKTRLSDWTLYVLAMCVAVWMCLKADGVIG